MKLKNVFCNLAVLSSLCLISHADATEILSELKVGYFLPTNHKCREIYSDGAIYGVEISGQAWRWIYSWASASYFSKSGRSIGEKHRTTITMVPVGVGLKALYRFEAVDLYAGLGVLGTYLHTKNHSHYVHRSTSKGGCGGIVKAGAHVNLGSGFFIDLYTDYSFIKIHAQNRHHRKKVIYHDANISGWSAGGGLGYRF